MKKLLIISALILSGCSRYDSYAEAEKAKYLFMAARENAVSWLNMGFAAIMIACCIAFLFFFVMFFYSYLDNMKRRQMRDMLTFHKELGKLSESNVTHHREETRESDRWVMQYEEWR